MPYVDAELHILMPHPLTVFADGDTVLLHRPPDGPMARCAETREHTGTLTIGGRPVPLRTVAFGSLAGLPAPADGVLYVVSRAAAEAAARDGRTDVVYPDDPVRDADGRVIGCRALAKAATSENASMSPCGGR